MFSTSQRVKRLQSLIEKDGHNQGAHYMLGEEYLRESRAMEAAAKFRRVVELNPDHAKAWQMMGKSLEAAGADKEAIMAYEEAAIQFGRQGDTERSQAMRHVSESLAATYRQ